MGARGQPRTGGRVPGTPNKINADFRSTVTALLEGNAQNVTQWLSEASSGRPAKKQDGTVILAANGQTVWDVKPDPARACEILGKLAEFAAPKLSRVEHTGDPLQPVQTVHRIELVPLSGNRTDPASS